MPMEQSMRQSLKFASAALALAAGLWGPGCPDASQTSAPVGECTEIGEQCRLPSGKLGVCNTGGSQKIECVPQH